MKTLDEVTLTHELTNGVSILAIGGNEAAESDNARVREKLTDFPDAANVLGSVFGAEPEVLVETVADVIPVQDIGQPVPLLDEDVFGRERDRALS